MLPLHCRRRCKAISARSNRCTSRISRGEMASVLTVCIRAEISPCRASWEWQYVFPAAKRSRDPRSGLSDDITYRLVLQQAVKVLCARTIASQRCHSFRRNPEYLLMPSRCAKQGESLHGRSLHSTFFAAFQAGEQPVIRLVTARCAVDWRGLLERRLFACQPGGQRPLDGVHRFVTAPERAHRSVTPPCRRSSRRCGVDLR